MRARFWGVRGSVPWATHGSIGHGCNTSCVELRSDDGGSILILDAGSGIVGLGEALSTSYEACPISIALSHYHWDHIQGLPFFAPLYQGGAGVAIRSPALGSADATWIESVFAPRHFPVAFAGLPSHPDVAVTRVREMELNGFRLGIHPLTHPGGSVAYRVRGTNGDLVYATDHEFGNAAADKALAAFCADAAVVVLDAHFTPHEAASNRGRGHSSWSDCVEFSAATRTGQLYLFHHKPGRTDAELHAAVSEAQRVFPATAAAAEGMSFEI